MNKIKNIMLCAFLLLSMLSVSFCTTPQVALTINSECFQNLSPYVREDAYKFYTTMYTPLTNWKNGHNNNIKGWAAIIWHAIFVGEMRMSSSMVTQDILSILDYLQEPRTSDPIIYVKKDEIVRILGVLIGQLPLNFTRFNCALIGSFLQEFMNECQRKNLETSNIYVSFVNHILEYLKNLQIGNERGEKQNKEGLIFSALNMGKKALGISEIISANTYDFLRNRNEEIQKECNSLNLESISKECFFDYVKINEILKNENEEFSKILVKRQFSVFKSQYYQFLSNEKKQYYNDLRCLLDDYFSENKRSLINLNNPFSLYNMFASNLLTLIPGIAGWCFSNEEDKYSAPAAVLLFSASIVAIFNLIFNGFQYYKTLYAIRPTWEEVDLCCFYSASFYNAPSFFPTQIKNRIILLVEGKNYNKNNSFFTNIQPILKGE